MANKHIWQETYPHLIALIVFYFLTIGYFFPLFQGKELAQHDSTQAQGMMHEAKTYKKYFGEITLWTNAMFGGMPTYHIWAPIQNNLVAKSVHTVTETIFADESEPIITFLLYAGFYVLILCITGNSWLSIIGAIGFALSSFNFISLEAGHITKVKAMAMIAPILGGLLLGVQRKYLLGAIVTGIFVALQIRQKHYQITFYTLILVSIVGIVYLILYLKEREYFTLLKILPLLLIGAVLGALTNTSNLWTTQEYAHETIRGGESNLKNTNDPSLQTSGLSYDYATRWSYGVMETLTLIIPNFYGGASTGELSEDSNVADAGLPNRYLDRIPLYWGNQSFTSGPVYFGAAIWLLFFFGLFIVKSPLKWGLLAATIVSIMLAWGSNFSILFDFFFNYVPYFNKFRTPSMAFVIAQVTVPCLGIMGIWELIKNSISKKELMKGLKYSLFITGGVVVVFGILGSFFYGYEGQMDARLENSGWPIEALRADREALLREDAFRSLIFIVIAAGAMWAYIQNKIKTEWLVIGLGIVFLVDLWMVDKRYLNADSFVEPKDYKQEFAPSQADMQIIQTEFQNNQKAQKLYKELVQKEKRKENVNQLTQLKKVDLKACALRFTTNYRVLNLASNTFNEAMTAYYHKSVGGYHAAKLRRFQELIERQISERNQDVLNMLNTKYIITSQGQNNKPKVERNPGRLGNAWFVSNYEIKKNATRVMNGLNNFNPSQTAIVNQKEKEHLKGFELNEQPQGKIELTQYEPNHLIYKSNTSKEQLAVFSEIYYNNEKGWKVYIDGEQVEHFRVNYVLRAMRIPAGEHEIEFKFYPKSYYTGEKIAMASSGLLLLGLLGTVIWNLLIEFHVINPAKKQED